MKTVQFVAVGKPAEILAAIKRTIEQQQGSSLVQKGA